LHFQLIEYGQKINRRVVSFSVTNLVEENKTSEEVFAASADNFQGSNHKPRKVSTGTLQDFYKPQSCRLTKWQAKIGYVS
jgi:hypothetical protein